MNGGGGRENGVESLFHANMRLNLSLKCAQQVHNITRRDTYLESLKRLLQGATQR
jgi:hypothetical protein